MLPLLPSSLLVLRLVPLKKVIRWAGKVEGVEVIYVERGSAAAKAGLRQSDIITWVNRQPVKNVDDVRRIAKSNQHGILLNIRRGDGALILVIP